MNVDKCRLCLEVENVIIDVSFHQYLIEEIQFLFDFNVIENKLLSSKICTRCTSKITDFSSFKKNVITNQKLLTSMAQVRSSSFNNSNRGKTVNLDKEAEVHKKTDEDNIPLKKLFRSEIENELNSKKTTKNVIGETTLHHETKINNRSMKSVSSEKRSSRLRARPDNKPINRQYVVEPKLRCLFTKRLYVDLRKVNVLNILSKEETQPEKNKITIENSISKIFEKHKRSPDYRVIEMSHTLYSVLTPNEQNLLDFLKEKQNKKNDINSSFNPTDIKTNKCVPITPTKKNENMEIQQQNSNHDNKNDVLSIPSTSQSTNVISTRSRIIPFKILSPSAINKKFPQEKIIEKRDSVNENYLEPIPENLLANECSQYVSVEEQVCKKPRLSTELKLSEPFSISNSIFFSNKGNKIEVPNSYNENLQSKNVNLKRVLRISVYTSNGLLHISIYDAKANKKINFNNLSDIELEDIKSCIVSDKTNWNSFIDALQNNKMERETAILFNKMFDI